MLFDGDKAGINATLRGIDIILAGLNVKICSFPNGRILIALVKVNHSKKLKLFK